MKNYTVDKSAWEQGTFTQNFNAWVAPLLYTKLFTLLSTHTYVPSLPMCNFSLLCNLQLFSMASASASSQASLQDGVVIFKVLPCIFHSQHC